MDNNFFKMTKYAVTIGEEGKLSIYEEDKDGTFKLFADDYTWDKFLLSFSVEIDERDFIEDFRVTEKGLEIDFVDFMDDGFGYERGTIKIFMGNSIMKRFTLFGENKYLADLKDLETAFSKVKKETAKKIKERIEACDAERKLMEALEKAIKNLVAGGTLGCEYDKVMMASMRKYALENEDKILDLIKKYFKDEKSASKILGKFFKDAVTVDTIITYSSTFAIAGGAVFWLCFFLDMFKTLAICALGTIGVAAPIVAVSAIIWHLKYKLPASTYELCVDGFYDMFLDILEKGLHEDAVEPLSSLEEKVVQDKFLDYVKADIEYMREHSELDFNEFISRYKELTSSYVAAKRREMKGELTIDRFSFLSELTELEIAVYSKIRGTGIKSTIVSLFREEALEERLEFLGLPSGVTLEDRCLQDVFKDINRVFRMPYEGCEEELATIFKIAQEYVQEAKKCTEPKGYGVTIPEANLIKKLSIVEARITERINSSIEADKLQSDLDTIHEYLEGMQGSTEERKTYQNRPLEQ